MSLEVPSNLGSGPPARVPPALAAASTLTECFTLPRNQSFTFLGVGKHHVHQSQQSWAPRAYSYVRFSRPEQLKGDSLRRQTQLAQAYADSHGLELDTALTFNDLGVSAYRGANFDEGALGRFIEAVDRGVVPA